MKKILSVISCLVSFSLFCNMAPEGFERFPNYYFVETGTFSGDGVQFALRAGFPEIHSLEIDSALVIQAKKRFKKQKKVHIYKGDSGLMLWNVIKNFKKPITFWLDGHNGFPDPKSKAKNCPVLEELEQIKKHPIKNHTIIIDDMHCSGTLLFDYITKEQIAKKIKEINSNYVISYIPGGDDGEYPCNIMVAQVGVKQS